LSGPFPPIDSRAARRRYDRAARSYSKASRLEEEVAARMLERLDYFKLAPTRILDAGSGPARDARRLAARYRGARTVAADFSLGMLQSRSRSWLRANPADALCGKLEQLPLANGVFELIWSNMALHALAEPLEALKEFQRVLKPEGLLMFSMLGPDSLKELRAAAGAERVHAFHDMHDIGDMLVAAGFSAPVMDMELLHFTYQDATALLGDLRASGQTSVRRDRARGLAGKRFIERLHHALEPRATFEVIYGHAWKAAPRTEREEPVKTIGIFKRIP
jgi:malonyl-CoA O-methyltransferase